jgi:hypothetical protein
MYQRRENLVEGFGKPLLEEQGVEDGRRFQGDAYYPGY